MESSLGLLGKGALECFERDGFAFAARPLSADALALLWRTHAQVADQPAYARPGYLSGIHNPFGPAAHIVDSWGLLDLCQSDELLDVVERLIGPDIVLWESEFILGTSAPAPHRDSALWPVEPLAGVTVRLAVTDGANTPPSLMGEPLAPGDVVVHDVALDEGWDGPTGREGCAQYVIHYMPAHARFNRDPDYPPNRRAARAAPLVNYPKRPIWLVRGSDRAGNDFVTGFASTVGEWSTAPW